MPVLYRACPRPGCPHLVGGGRVCPDHTRRPWGGQSQAQRTGQPRLPEAVRMRVLKRDLYTCCECGKGQATQVDHVVARAEGGTDDEGNLVTRCDDCHARKSGREGARARARRRSAA